METGQGYDIATEVCSMLKSRPEVLIELIEALKDSQDGQSRLGADDSSGAIPLLWRAHDRFECIREARPLLGISKADLAAAYCNLGQYRKAADLAEDCISIVQGVRRLAFTEAMARITLATSWGIWGRAEDSEREFESAETILKGLPDVGRYLEALEMNRRSVPYFSHGHQFSNRLHWILGILFTMMAIAVIIYLFA